MELGLKLNNYPAFPQSVYFQDSEDSQSAELLKTAKLIPFDPYSIFSIGKRNQAVLKAFDTAGQRLNACMGLGARSASDTVEQLYSQWMEMKSRLSERSLQEHPDWMDEAMDLVFNIERQTSETCGTPTPADQMLLLIAKKHEGS